MNEPNPPLRSNSTQVNNGTSTYVSGDQLGLGVRVVPQPPPGLALNPSTRTTEGDGVQNVTHPQMQERKKERGILRMGVYIMPLKQYKKCTPVYQQRCRPMLLAEARERHAAKSAKPTLTTSQANQPLLLHGLSVNEYRAVYRTVVEPFATTSCTLPSYSDAQGLYLKARLWLALDRPKLEEVVHEDGRVEVVETFTAGFCRNPKFT